MGQMASPKDFHPFQVHVGRAKRVRCAVFSRCLLTPPPTIKSNIPHHILHLFSLSA